MAIRLEGRGDYGGGKESARAYVPWGGSSKVGIITIIVIHGKGALEARGEEGHCSRGTDGSWQDCPFTRACEATQEEG